MNDSCTWRRGLLRAFQLLIRCLRELKSSWLIMMGEIKTSASPDDDDIDEGVEASEDHRMAKAKAQLKERS